MTTYLRALIVEDSEDDAMLMARELRRGGYDVTFERVDTPAATKEALDRQSWDIVLSDYSMPSFSGLEALKILKESDLDIPFILISGTIGEETAVEVMKAGAHDFLTKGNLTRLIPAIERELRDAEVRREHKQAQKALRESEEKYRLIAENMTDIIWTMDMNLRFTYMSPSVTSIGGYSVDEAMALSLEEIFTPASLAIAMETFAEEVAADKTRPREAFWSRVAELEQRHKNGSTIWTEVTMNFLHDAEGQPIGIIGLTRDITDRKKTEEEIQRLSKVVETTPEAVVITDRQGTIEYVNQGLLTLGGFEDNSLIIGKSVFMFSNEEGVKQLKEEIIPTILSEGKWRGEVPVKRKNGSFFPAEMICSRTLDEEGKLKCLLSLYRDITKKKEAEEELQERMNELETFYRATLDREERVIELKQEVNQLLEQLGKNKKYRDYSK